jgi:hypothetical protein
MASPVRLPETYVFNVELSSRVRHVSQDYVSVRKPLPTFQFIPIARRDLLPMNRKARQGQAAPSYLNGLVHHG